MSKEYFDAVWLIFKRRAFAAYECINKCAFRKKNNSLYSFLGLYVLNTTVNFIDVVRHALSASNAQI